jgi:hypothetical protein
MMGIRKYESDYFITDYESRCMDELRVIVAIMVFSVSTYLVYDLFAAGFSWAVLLVCIGGYVLVHYIWPKKSSEDSNWYDILEILVDLPYRSIALAIRSIGKMLRNSDGDIGIDL